ncbi:MFS transporter, ACDE family, multidrug resistance protein [Thalassobacillus cyri]|uniref:MFS transporter, ACDE family, multidrug resistance protein n=1 Tax=Thalassobacillus cyri TaxID=571932 RepID=A0A1H4EHZ7_9BACI|nr:MFS transporter [Thalassobacillus cyri]SEA84653.1 MFS transporter, ACDE family, multidrug resistance protein [Thalassobacillus cyri]
MKKKKWDLVALASIPLVMTLGNSMLIPVLPIIEKEINISPFQSSLIITVYSLVAILLIPIAGYLSDKLGRKKVIIPSLIIAGLGGVVSAFAAWKMTDPYFIILIGRFLQGIGAAGAFPVVIPTVGDMFEDEEQVSAGLGLIETSNTFGKVLSPVLGALLAVIIWFIPFVAIPVLSLIAIGLVLKFVKVPKESGTAEKTSFSQFKQSIKEVFHHNGRWLMAIFIIGCINMFVLFGFLFHFSSLLESKYTIQGAYKGLVLAIPLLFLCVASYICGKKIGENKLLMKWAVIFGNGASACTLLFIKNETGLIMFLVLLSIAGLGIGFSLPSLDALITEGIDKEVRGTITSLYSSMRFLGVAAGPPVIAILMDRYPASLYLSLAVLSGIAVIVTFFTIKPTNESKEVKLEH